MAGASRRLDNQNGHSYEHASIQAGPAVLLSTPARGLILDASILH